MNEGKLKEIEDRLEKLEKKVQEHDRHLKTDIKGDMKDKEKLKELEKKINFIDGKVEKRLGAEDKSKEE